MARSNLSAWAFGAAAVAFAPSAFAAPLVISASEDAGGARLSMRYADGRAAPPPATASVQGGVLIVSFDDPLEADISGLAAGAPKTIAFARAGGDGKSLRISLRRTVTPKLAASGGASIIALPASAKPAPAPKPLEASAPNGAATAAKAGEAPGKPVDMGVISELTPSTTSTDVLLSVGARPEFTRLSFLFPHGATLVPLLSGDQLTLKFSRPGEVDISDLRILPPKFLKDARKLSKPGQPLALQLTLEPGVRQRHFIDGPRVVIDLLPPEEKKAPPPAPVIAQAAPAPVKPAPDIDPAPKSGIVKVVEEEGASATTFAMRWATPARAAAFRRGEAIWILFDTKAALDIKGIPLVGARHTNLQAIHGENVTGLRIAAPPEILVTAKSDGATWTFILSQRAAPLEQVAPVSRQAGEQGGSKLVADFARDGRVRWVEDPEIGDRFAAALIAGPVKAVDARRATMEAAILPAAQGAAVEPRADGVGAAFENGQLIVSRGEGLLSSNIGGPVAPGDEPDTAPLNGPVLMDLSQFGGQPKEKARDLLSRLQRTAAAEGVDPGAKADARMALARFLLAQELSAETLGALRIAALNQPELQESGEFKLMRAAANLMMGRVKDSQADLASGALADDPAAALWRGYAASLQENWPIARRSLEQGRGALGTQPQSWRVRFNLTLAEAALELNDFAAVEQAAAAAFGEAATDEQRAQAQLLQGRLAYARNDVKAAQAIFDKVSMGRDEAAAVRAILENVKLKRETNEMPLQQAAESLEALRYRWRGDGAEMEIIQALGHVYEDMGRWREALGVMAAASARFPDLQASRRLRIDMGAMFERLFLDGEADKLQPIQALGLFYEFKDLTPVGASGDRMIRMLSARLVSLDLLDKAAELLQYQVDNRLDGVGQAQVAADLASIYLADRQPEKAMMAIESTRQPGIPASIAAERRIVEAKALLDLNQFDHVFDLLEKDTSLEAANMRAEVLWRQKNWVQAANAFAIVLQRRPDETADLNEADRANVLRAAIAAVLGENKPVLDKLKKTYTARMVKSPDAAAFELVSSSPDPSDYRLRDLARRLARTDLVAKVLEGLKAKLAKDAPPKA
jgi:hypothetical protein